MAFLVGGANSAADTGYNIDNSVRVDDGSSPYLHRTPSSQGSLRKFTFSAWIKKTENTGGTTFQFLLHSGEADGDPAFGIGFRGDAFAMIDMSSSTYHIQLYSNALFRDPSAWYHMVVAVDTEQGTAANRVKVYMNNEQITSWATGTLPDEDHDLDGGLNKTSDPIEIGRDSYGGGEGYIDGYLSEVYFIDGTQYAPSDFGEADEDSGIWKPKDAKDDLTFGTNGFYLEFKASAVGTGASDTIGADTSGEDNHLTSSGIAVTDQTTDSPTNNWCTMNPLDNYLQAATFAEGNCKLTTNASNYSTTSSTMGVANGKWYFEGKCTTVNDSLIGISGQTETSSSNGLGQNSNQHGYLSSGNARTDGNDTSSGYDSYTDDDIISVAFDCDGNKVYFGKNGTWQNSADPAAGSNGIAITAPASTSTGFYTPGWGDNGSSAAVWEANFGNPSFAISSSQADDAGYGNFEYDVPAGFYALCTKNLAEFG